MYARIDPLTYCNTSLSSSSLLVGFFDAIEEDLEA
jgi:hypothetical protein